MIWSLDWFLSTVVEGMCSSSNRGPYMLDTCLLIVRLWHSLLKERLLNRPSAYFAQICVWEADHLWIPAVVYRYAFRFTQLPSGFQALLL